MSDPHSEDVIDTVMAKRFINYKYRCHQHYKKYTPAEAKQNPIDGVDKDDWIALCDHFEDESFKVMINLDCLILLNI